MRRYNVYSDDIMNDRDRKGGQGRHREWEERTERKPTGCSLTFSDVVAAAAVIFPSGGNKVTLACARTGDRRSGRLRRWRRPLLTRAGVSRGDRSEELLTGGPWHTHTQHLPQEMQRQHIFPQEVGMEKQGGWEVIRFLPLTLFYYFILVFH